MNKIKIIKKWYREMYFETSALYDEDAEDLIKRLEESPEIPYCHGEPMQPSLRYLKKGVIYQTFKCNFVGCQHTEEVELK